MQIEYTYLNLLFSILALLFVFELSNFYMFAKLPTFIREKVIEPMENNEAVSKTNCDTLDAMSIQTINETTKNINTVRERLNAINIKELNTKLDSVDTLIKNNTADLKDIIDQHRTSSNDTIGMDVKEDGSVYDENGKLIHPET